MWWRPLPIPWRPIPTSLQANATGRSAKSVREYLEKNYSPEAVKTRDSTTMLAIKALLEVVQSGSKNMEVAVIEKGKTLEVGLISVHLAVVYTFILCMLTCTQVSLSLSLSLIQFLDTDQIDHYVKQIEKAREEEAERRKAKKSASASSSATPATSSTTWA